MANISAVSMDELVAGLRNGSFPVPEATFDSKARSFGALLCEADGITFAASDSTSDDGASGSTASAVAVGDAPGPSHGKKARMSLPGGLAPPAVAAILAEKAHAAAVAKRTRSSVAVGSSAPAVGGSSRGVVPSTADDAPMSSVVDGFLDDVVGGFNRDDWIENFGFDGNGSTGGVTVDVVTAPSKAKRARRSASSKVDLATVKAAVAAAPRKTVVGRPTGAAGRSTDDRVPVPPKRLIGAWRECELQVELARIKKAASEGNRMTCPFCAIVYTKTSNMVKHAEDACVSREPVLKDWRYVCNGCPRTFGRRDAYVRHIAAARCKKLKATKLAKR